MIRLASPIFDHDHSKNIWSAFIFCEFVSTCKKSVLPSVHSSDTVPAPDCPHPFLTMPTPKCFYHLLICMNLYQHAKHQLIPFVRFWVKVKFRVQRPDCPHPFSAMPNQKLIDQLLILVNLYQHAKLRLFYWFVLEK